MAKSTTGLCRTHNPVTDRHDTVALIYKIVRGYILPSAGQKIQVQPGWYLPLQKMSLAKNGFPGWYLPLQKMSLAKNGFLQAGKGAENTKEKYR
jgi:hypothetical protein